MNLVLMHGRSQTRQHKDTAADDDDNDDDDDDDWSSPKDEIVVLVLWHWLLPICVFVLI